MNKSLILVVEDEVLIRDIIKVIFTQQEIMKSLKL